MQITYLHQARRNLHNSLGEGVDSLVDWKQYEYRHVPRDELALPVATHKIPMLEVLLQKMETLTMKVDSLQTRVNSFGIGEQQHGSPRRSSVQAAKSDTLDGHDTGLGLGKQSNCSPTAQAAPDVDDSEALTRLSSDGRWSRVQNVMASLRNCHESTDEFGLPRLVKTMSAPPQFGRQGMLKSIPSPTQDC